MNIDWFGFICVHLCPSVVSFLYLIVNDYLFRVELTRTLSIRAFALTGGQDARAPGKYVFKIEKAPGYNN